MGYLLNKLGSLLSETTPEGTYTANVTPPARGAQTVDLNRAVTLPAVYDSLAILGGVGSLLTLNGWRGSAVVKPTPSLILAPDPWRDLGDWVERCIISLATDGNLFLRKYRAADNITTASAEVLDPFLTHVRWVKGIKSYTTFDHRLGRFIDLADADVLHVWGLQLPGRTRGLGPVAACRLSLGGALDVRDYASTWFADGDVPSGVLSSDQALDAKSVAMYRQIWADPTAFDDQPDAATINKRLGPSVRVLGKGLTYSAITLKPEDAQWLQAQNWGVLEVARIWGMPANYVLAAVEGSNMTYQSLEMIDTQFMRLTLRPRYLRKIEAALSSLLPRGQVARFDLSEWLRPDTKTQAEVDKTYIDAGVVSPQDVRDRLRIPGTAPGKPAATPAPAREDAPA